MSIRARSLTLYCLLTVTCVFVVERSAAAQSQIGVRAGVSAGPEQLYFGGHVDVAEIVSKFWFRPNIEIGFGDRVTVAAFNGEFVYLITDVLQQEWTPYVGGGPAFVLRSFDLGNNDRDTDGGPGFNFVGGIQRRKGLFGEIKFGVIDSPDFKFGIGWRW